MASDTRTAVKTWMRAEIGDQPVIHAAELAKKAAAHFRADPEFIEQYLEESLGALMHRSALEALQSTRGKLVAGAVPVTTGNVRMTREEISRKAKNMKRFITWREHVPARGGHVMFKELTRADLVSAAEERRKRSHSELVISRFEETLAARMTDDTATVGDVFSDSELDEIYSSLQGEGE